LHLATTRAGALPRVSSWTWRPRDRRTPLRPLPWHPQLHRRRGPDGRRQLRHRAGPPAAGARRARDRQDDVGPGGRRGPGAPAADLACEVDDPGQGGAVPLRCGPAAERQPLRGRRCQRHPALHPDGGAGPGLQGRGPDDPA